MSKIIILLSIILIAGCTEPEPHNSLNQYIEFDFIKSEVIEIRLTENLDLIEPSDIYSTSYHIIKEIVCSNTPFGEQFIEKYGVEFNEKLCKTELNKEL